MELIIKPQKALKIDWKELWAYRELFYFFVWRDIKVRYKQTLIGASWAILQPLASMVIFTIFFNKVIGIQTPIPYAIFSYAGLLFWNYFSTALIRSSEGLASNQGIVTKIYFPRIIAPLSATLVGLVDFFFASLVFIGLMIYFQIVPGLSGILLFLPMLLVTFLAAAGLGLFFATVNVKYRDVRQLLPFLIQVLLFLTPVIYPVTLVPERYQWLLYLNPMTGVITAMRSSLLHEGPLRWDLIPISISVALVLFVFGFWYFKRKERGIADII